MIKKELIDKLNALGGDDIDGDPERNHGMADELLLEFINDIDVRNAFKSTERWYA